MFNYLGWYVDRVSKPDPGPWVAFWLIAWVHCFPKYGIGQRGGAKRVQSKRAKQRHGTKQHLMLVATRQHLEITRVKTSPFRDPSSNSLVSCS